MKKIIITLVLSLLMTNVFGFTVNGINYSSLGGSVQVINGNYIGAIIIPSTVTYDGVIYDVTTIGFKAFSGAGITSISLPSSISIIADFAFYNCTNLKYLILFSETPPPITFNYNIIPKLFVPIKSISAYKADSEWNKAPIYGIGSASPSDISMLNYTPNSGPSDQKSVYINGFFTDSLIITSPTNFEISTISGTAFLGKNRIAFASKIGALSDTTFYVRLKAGLPQNTYTGNITIASTGFTTQNVALSGTVRTVPEIINVTIPGTLSSLLSAIEKTSIKKLIVTGNIDARDIKCMRDEMTKLADLDISNAKICAYTGSEGTDVGLRTYPENAMPYCSFSPPMNPTGGKNTLTNIKLPNFLTSIETYALAGCSNLTCNLVIPSTVTSIGEYSFFCCWNMTGKLIIPNSVTSIGDNAFSCCWGFTGNLTIPNSVTTIGQSAFWKDSFSGTLKLSSSITSIGNGAFNAGPNFMKIIMDRTIPPTIQSVTFGSINKTTCVLLVPKGTCDTYKAADYWSDFVNIIEYVLTIKTKPVTSITLTSATLNGNIDIITDAPVTAHGFCWNTSGSPTIADSKINNGTATSLGAYSSNINGLAQGTKYFVRAYATDGENPVYGNEVTFTTPVVPNAAGQISGVPTVCQGQNSVIYTVPAIDNATSYTWTLPTGATGTSTTNSITVNFSITAISGNITVRGHNQWGDGAVSTLAISVNLLPINAGIISGNISVCQGQNSVNYSVPTIDNATSYSWILPTGANGTSTTNSINVNFTTNAVSGNITVKGHNDCGDGVVSTLPITVNQLPIISVSDKTVTCGGSVALNASTNYSGSGTGTVSYQWSPTTGLNDATIANPIATVTNDITYTVTINTPNSCSTSKSLSVTIIAMDKPEIGMVGVNSDNKNLIAWNKPISSGIESYNIYRETNVTNVYEKIGTVPYESMSIFVDNQSLPDVQSNKYKLSILDRHGLESPQSNSHKTMHLAINKGIGNAWNLSWEAYEGFVVSTYNIYRGTTLSNITLLGSTSGSNTQYNDLNAPSGNVYYQLEVISPNSVNPTKVISSQKTKAEENGLSNSQISYSSSRSNIATNVVSGINELGENNKINIYPNPVKNELRIDFEDGSTFEILNLIGQVVYNGNLIQNTIVQTSNLSSGVYLIKFKTGKSFEYKKIIKE